MSFSIKYAGKGDLFEGLSVCQWEEFTNLQGTYPVISLSFANIKEKTYEVARRKICQIITDLYSDYTFLLEGDILSEKEKDFFKGVSVDMDDVSATMAIHYLSKYLNLYYGKKVIILLDEYDTPCRRPMCMGIGKN